MNSWNKSGLDEFEEIIGLLWSVTWPLIVVLGPLFLVAFCSVPK